MIANVIIIEVVLVLIISSPHSANETLRVATYNILNYDGDSRTSYLETVYKFYDVDAIIIQEMLNHIGLNF